MKSLLLTIMLALNVSPLWAQTVDMSKKSVTVIIPFPPGGGVDQTYQHFRRYLNARNITTNAVYKSGADGLIGMNEIERANPDGTTISIGTAGTVAVHEIKKSQQNLIVVSAIRNSVTAFVASTHSGIKQWHDLESRIQQNQPLRIGQGAPGQKMSVTQLVKLINPRYSHDIVSYRGGSPVVNDLLGGHIDFAALPLSLVHSHIQSGRLTLIGVGSRQRLDTYKFVPSVYEKLSNWQEFDGFVLILPPGSSAAVQTHWTNMLTEYLNDPLVKQEFVDNFFELLPIGSEPARQLVIQSIKNLK